MRNIRSKRDVFNGILFFVYKYTLRITGNRRRGNGARCHGHSEVSNVSVVHPYDPGARPCWAWGCWRQRRRAPTSSLPSIPPRGRAPPAGGSTASPAKPVRTAAQARPRRWRSARCCPPGARSRPAPGTVVFLSHNGDRLIIQPNSRLRIDEPGTAGLLDHFMQSLGSVFYDVEPRKRAVRSVSPRPMSPRSSRAPGS